MQFRAGVTQAKVRPRIERLRCGSGCAFSVRFSGLCLRGACWRVTPFESSPPGEVQRGQPRVGPPTASEAVTNCQPPSSRARITVPRAKRLLRVAAAVLSVSVMSGPRSRSTLMRQPAPSSAWKSWLRRSIARPTCQTSLHNSRSFRALPALHEQLCAQRPPCLAYRYRRFRRRKVRRPQRSTWAAR